MPARTKSLATVHVAHALDFHVPASQLAKFHVHVDVLSLTTSLFRNLGPILPRRSFTLE